MANGQFLNPDESERFRKLVLARLRKLRLSQNELAEKTKICRSDISKQLSGAKRFRLEHATQIAKVLEIRDFQFFLDAGPDRFPVTVFGPDSNSGRPAGSASPVGPSGGPFHLDSERVSQADAPVSYIWDPTKDSDSVDVYFDHVMWFFREYGPELVYSDKLITRQMLPEIEWASLFLKADTTVCHKYSRLCAGMCEFWDGVRRSGRRKNARITNILRLENFEALVKRPLRAVPPGLRDKWWELRLDWLRDVERQIIEGRFLPLFVPEASLQNAVAKSRALKRLVNANATIAVVNQAHTLRRLRSTSEVMITSDSGTVQEIYEALKHLEAHAFKVVGPHPEDAALKVVEKLADWCKAQPRWSAGFIGPAERALDLGTAADLDDLDDVGGEIRR